MQSPTPQAAQAYDARSSFLIFFFFTSMQTFSATVVKFSTLYIHVHMDLFATK